MCPQNAFPLTEISELRHCHVSKAVATRSRLYCMHCIAQDTFPRFVFGAQAMGSQLLLPQVRQYRRSEKRLRGYAAPEVGGAAGLPTLRLVEKQRGLSRPMRCQGRICHTIKRDRPECGCRCKISGCRAGGSLLHAGRGILTARRTGGRSRELPLCESSPALKWVCGGAIVAMVWCRHARRRVEPAPAAPCWLLLTGGTPHGPPLDPHAYDPRVDAAGSQDALVRDGEGRCHGGDASWEEDEDAKVSW